MTGPKAWTWAEHFLHGEKAWQEFFLLVDVTGDGADVVWKKVEHTIWQRQHEQKLLEKIDGFVALGDRIALEKISKFDFNRLAIFMSIAQGDCFDQFLPYQDSHSLLWGLKGCSLMEFGEERQRRIETLLKKISWQGEVDFTLINHCYTSFQFGGRGKIDVETVSCIANLIDLKNNSRFYETIVQSELMKLNIKTALETQDIEGWFIYGALKTSLNLLKEDKEPPHLWAFLEVLMERNRNNKDIVQTIFDFIDSKQELWNGENEKHYLLFDFLIKELPQHGVCGLDKIVHMLYQAGDKTDRALDLVVERLTDETYYALQKDFDHMGKMLDSSKEFGEKIHSKWVAKNRRLIEREVADIVEQKSNVFKHKKM